MYIATEGSPGMNDELEAHMRLAQFLREQYEAAGDYQHNLIEMSVKADQPLDAENKVFHVMHADKHVPTGYDRILYGPRHERAPDPRIPKLAVNFPVISGSERWNDVFFQVWNRRGKSHDYLFNSEGLIPFRDARTDVDTIFGFDQEGQQIRDMYMVTDRLVLRNPATIQAIGRLLLDTETQKRRYVWHPQADAELK